MGRTRRGYQGLCPQSLVVHTVTSTHGGEILAKALNADKKEATMPFHSIVDRVRDAMSRS